VSRRTQLVLALIAGCGVLIVLLGMGLSRGPTLDASVFMTVARTVASGGLPYRDAWDHKPPGIYLIEAAASFVLPVGDWVRAWAISAAASIGTIAVVAMTLARRVPSVGAIAVTLIAGALLIGCHLVALGGGYSEPLALFPATIALVVGTRSDPTRRDALVAGLAASCAALISLQLAPAFLAILAVQAVGEARLSRIGSFLVGASVVPLIVGAWLASAGALPAAWDALVVYNRVYVGNRDAPGLDTLRRALPVLLIASPLIAGSLARSLRIVAIRRASRLELACLLWIGLWLVYVVAQGDFLAHYAIAIAAPLMILCGLGLGDIVASVRQRGAMVAGALLMASLVIPVLLVVRSEPGPGTPRQVPDAATAVDTATGSAARLFVWGNEPLLYLEADRAPASRYVFLRPLTTPGYSDAAQAAALLDAWVAHPPDVIVDASINPGGVQAYPLLRPWSFGGTPLPDELDPLRAFVRSHYTETAQVGNWLIYLPAATP
jgi:hypothetical protein